MAGFVGLLALSAIVVGILATVLGGFRPLRIYSRRAGVGVIVGGFALLYVTGLTMQAAKSPVLPAMAPATIAAAPAPTTLLDVSGSGIKTTQAFTVGPTWAMTWSYDCSAFGSRGNFIVNVMTTDGHGSRNAGTNQLGTGGSDVEHFHVGGTFYLEINSECGWHVTVQG
jgi:hypothetical protein